MPRLRFDLECDNLLDKVTKIHCIVTQDKDTDEICSYYDDKTVEHHTYAGDIEAGIINLLAAEELVGQNIIGYDIPVIEKLHKANFKPFLSDRKIKDLLVCSRITYLDLKDRDFNFRKADPTFPGNLIGSHSLKAWGWRLGVRKGDFGEMDDWATFTKEMLEYCIQDIKVTEALENKLDSKNYSADALLNEHRFAYLIHLQQEHGFRFNRQAAVELYGKLSQRRNDLEIALKEACVGWYEEMKQPEFYTLTYSTMGSDVPQVFRGATKSACEDERKARGVKPKACVIEAGPNKQKHTPFNPGSHDHIAKFLVEEYSWKPLVFTDDGKAQTSEEVLSSLPYPEIKPIVEYLMVEKRIGQLAEGNQAWLKLEDNGRVHGEVNTNGAVSSRVTHSKPNMSQVPAIDKPYGKECRALFCADEGQVLVGADASGIQLRALAHYLHPWDGGEYGKIILTGSSKNGTDIHTMNQKAAGFATRDMAKTFI